MMEPNEAVQRVPGVQHSVGEPILRLEPSAQRPRAGRPVTGVRPELTHEATVGALSFPAWYTSTRPTIVRALSLSLGDDELAVEAADEALTRAFQHWNTVQSLDNPGGWAYRVGLNWATSVFRRRRLPRRVHHDIDADMPVPADASIARALTELDVHQRTVVVCRHLLGWSEQQTADILQIRPGTVKSRLSRANATLRNQLGHLRQES